MVPLEIVDQVLSPRKYVDELGVPVAARPVEGMSPVQLVKVPELGVPNAPLKVIKAPAEPTFMAKAVATPVPNPVIPEIGSPVALVKVNEAGVPIARPFGRVVLILGTEPAEVTKTPEAAVLNPETAVPFAAYQAS